MNRFGWLVLLAIVGGFGFMVWPRGGGAPVSQAQVLPPGAPPARGTDGIVIPVEGIRPAQLSDTWGQSRDSGARAHQGIDIVAPRGTPVVAAFGGTVSKLFNSRDGGMAVYIRDGTRQAYYAHLDSYAPGLREGQRVASGQRIGEVGDSGNAGAGNTHLHFAVNEMAAGDSWWQGRPINPYPLLRARR